MAIGLLLLSAAARAENVSLVAWGESPDFVTSNQNTQRSSSSGEIPFSLATPITPADGYDDTLFYAGIKAIGTGGLNYGAKIVNDDPYNGGGNDTFVFGRTATGAQSGDQVTGVFIWKRSDFRTLATPVSNPLTVEKLTFRGRVNGTVSSARARFVLKSGDSYIISDNMGLNTSYTSTPKVLSNLSSVNWYSYDPADINTIGPAVGSPDFTNIDGVGLFLTATNAGTGALLLAFSSFDAEGNTKPLVFSYYPTYRQSSNLPIGSIPWSKTSHIVHSFATADADGVLTGVTGYLPSSTLVSTAHSNGVKVLLALGGGANSANFTAMAQDLTKRNAFVAAVANWVSTYGYDGIVLDWEFPGAGDAQKLVNFVYGLRTALPPGSEIGLNVGTSAYASAGVVATQIPSDNPNTTLDELIDYLMVMSYDYHGSWNYAGYNAPLFAVSGVGDDFSFDKTWDWWTVTKGFSASRVIMGLPFYGRGVTGFTAFGSSVTGDTTYTYIEMLSKISSGQWTLYRDTTTGMTDVDLYESHELPHMVKSGEMISYEDTQSIPPKVRWFRGKGLQGYLIWEIGQDYDGTTNLLLDSAREVW
ncbi:hypothetical protein OPIT5_20365 [Opitutaceae bacterium TAV5]|nr:hypothetical protein OPIT5_20365 [Opitutaceae bacterium TAV5]